MFQKAGSPRWFRPLLAVLAVAGFALPILLYWLVIGRAPGVSPTAAKRMLAAGSGNVVLVDIRAAEDYEAGHLDGAEGWPFAEIRALDSVKGVPTQFLGGRRLLLLCRSGITAAVAARHLRALGLTEVWKVDDGLQGWIAESAGGPGGVTAFCRLLTASGETRELPARESSRVEQWAAALSGFVVKPFYMLLSLVLIVWLWRSAAPDLAALRRSMAAFLVGEGFCAANYLFFRDQSHLAEFLHSYGMVLAFGFAAWAILEGLDRRLVGFSDPERRCAALPLCGPCVKHAEVSCGLKRVFILLIPCAIVLGLMPLTAEPEMVSYNTAIFGAPYNWSHATVYQLFEMRFCPLYGIALLAAALLVLLARGLRGVPAAKLLFAAGLGPVGFGLFRLFLFGPYRDNLVWFAFWEEITELIFIVGAAAVLWIFRARLFANPGESQVRGDESTGDACGAR